MNNTSVIGQENSRDNIVDFLIKIALFMISPFIAFFYSLPTAKKNHSYFFFFGFAFFWCLIQCVNYGKAIGFGEDINAYRKHFEDMASSGGYFYIDDLQRYIRFEATSSGYKDIYAQTIEFLVSNFTDNYHIFFAVCGSILAYFMLRTFTFLTNNQNYKNYNLACMILAFMFVMHAPLYRIGGLRFITAGWIYLYCLFQIIINNNKRYCFLLCITPLIHFSFWSYLIVFVVSYSLRKNSSIGIILIILSFFIQFLVSVLYDYLLNLSLPYFLVGHGGSSEFQEQVDESIRNASLPVYILRGFIIPLYPTYIAYVFYKYRDIVRKESETTYYMLMVSIQFIFFYNVLSVLPEVGRRFGWLVYTPISYVLLSSNIYKMQKGLLHSYVLIFAFTFILEFNESWTKYTSLEDWLSSPIILIDKYILNNPY